MAWGELVEVIFQQTPLQSFKMTSEIEIKKRETDVETSCVEDADRKMTTAYTLQPKDERNVVPSGLERRLMWKQDLLILPLLALIYFVTFLV